LRVIQVVFAGEVVRGRRVKIGVSRAKREEELAKERKPVEVEARS